MKIYIQTDIEGCAGYCFYQSRKQTQENRLPCNCTTAPTMSLRCSRNCAGAGYRPDH